MANLAAPITIHDNGQVVASGLPKQNIGPPASNLMGGLINSAANKTALAMKAQASHAKQAGVTMKGGAVVNVPQVAEGGSIPGVSFSKNHANLISTANQLKANGVYDGLLGGQPYKVGGSRRRRRISARPGIMEIEPVLTAGRKHRRKTKKHVRRRKSRSIHRVSGRRVRRSRRSNLNSV
jgi:hypothetical protein